MYLFKLSGDIDFLQSQFFLNICISGYSCESEPNVPARSSCSPVGTPDWTEQHGMHLEHC